jgi:hypothetical protein
VAWAKSQFFRQFFSANTSYKHGSQELFSDRSCFQGSPSSFFDLRLKSPTSKDGVLKKPFKALEIYKKLEQGETPFVIARVIGRVCEKIAQNLAQPIFAKINT